VAYGKPVAAAGPVYRRQRVTGARITVEFDDGGAGLASRSGNDSVSGFAIAGEDRRWVWAEARLEGNRVVVWSPQVPEPVAVRYAWSNSPRAPGLVGGSGLPATPFRTDDW
jgi:sialate O-acetylesterase